MNEHDSERLAGLLENEGMEPTDDVGEADVVVLNTCCIRENADNRLYGHLGQLKAVRATRPGMQIAVGGCLAQKDRGLVQQKADQVDVVFGTHNVGRLVELLRKAERDGPVMEILDEAPAEDSALFPSALPVRRNLAYAAWVTIQIGCDNSCAFCIVPAVRGREISRPFGDVVAEVESLARSGAVEVTLLGQNVNSYGRDITTALRSEGSSADVDANWRAGRIWADAEQRRARPLFADLLRAVGAVRGVRRVRYTSPHPKDLRPETISAMAEVGAVCEHLHLFLFSPRPGTRAAAMTDVAVPAEVAAERFARLKVVVERSALAKHHDRLGAIEEVLIEGPSKRDPRVLTGRTRQNKLVHFPAPDTAPPSGAFADVKVTTAAPHHLGGELVQVTARPRRRAGIPVRAG
jgi:tRNA-2-methylthio-N6-dimethylallyladenosine synthase